MTGSQTLLSFNRRSIYISQVLEGVGVGLRGRGGGVALYGMGWMGRLGDGRGGTGEGGVEGVRRGGSGEGERERRTGEGGMGEENRGGGTEEGEQGRGDGRGETGRGYWSVWTGEPVTSYK
jgi:hypothetical protein